MKNQIILSISVIFLLVLALNLTSAIRVSSLPTSVSFYTGPSNPPSLEITIISPINGKTYTTHQVPLIVQTNNIAACYWSIDNGITVPFKFDRDTYFSKNLTLNNGNHKILIQCKDNNEVKSATTNFTVNVKTTPENENHNNALQNDLAYENQLRTPVYGQWLCINNRLQRTVTVLNMQSLEYGAECGLNIGPTTQSKNNNYSIWIILLIFLILILIVLVLIALLLARRNN